MKSMQTLVLTVACAAGCLVVRPANATPIVNLGDIFLAANTRNQLIALSVSGGDNVQGLNLNLSVEKGGTEFSPQGKPGPRITNVNVVNNTIFAGNNDGQTTIGTFPQAWVVATATSAGTVRAEGTLAWVTFDTTGFSANSGPFTLSLSDPTGAPTDFAGVPARLSDGQLRLFVVPEPSSWLCVTVGACCLLSSRRRRV